MDRGRVETEGSADAVRHVTEDHQHCTCVLKVLHAIEQPGSSLERVIIGAIKSAGDDHGIRFSASLTKRIRGQIRGYLRGLLSVDPPPRFDPWKQHCNTCQCEADAIRRVKGPHGTAR